MRLKILFGVAAVLLAALVWNIFSNWGLVTVHENEAPISTVLRKIERQGGIKILSSADPAMPVTLHVDKVSPAEAVATLADWMEANWSVTYVAAGDKGTVRLAIDNLANGQRNENFRSFRARGGDMLFGDVTIDPRKVEWTVSPSDSGELQAYLDQFTQKTGTAAMVPEDWNPVLTKTPQGGKAASAVRSLVKAAGGAVEEVFVLRVPDWNGPSESGPASATPRTASAGGPPSGERGPGDWGGGRSRSNPEWEAERVEAQLAQLPDAERERVRNDMNEMRAFWDRVRSLPESERRAEMERMFNDPTVQERMMEREASREGRRSPERRVERFRRYIERKNEMKQQQQQQQPS